MGATVTRLLGSQSVVRYPDLRHYEVQEGSAPGPLVGYLRHTADITTENALWEHAPCIGTVIACPFRTFFRCADTRDVPLYTCAFARLMSPPDPPGFHVETRRSPTTEQIRIFYSVLGLEVAGEFTPPPVSHQYVCDYQYRSWHDGSIFPLSDYGVGFCVADLVSMGGPVLLYDDGSPSSYSAFRHIIGSWEVYDALCVVSVARSQLACRLTRSHYVSREFPSFPEYRVTTHHHHLCGNCGCGRDIPNIAARVFVHAPASTTECPHYITAQTHIDADSAVCAALNEGAASDPAREILGRNITPAQAIGINVLHRIRVPRPFAPPRNYLDGDIVPSGGIRVRLDGVAYPFATYDARVLRLRVKLRGKVNSIALRSALKQAHGLLPPDAALYTEYRDLNGFEPAAYASASSKHLQPMHVTIHILHAPALLRLDPNVLAAGHVNAVTPFPGFKTDITFFEDVGPPPRNVLPVSAPVSTDVFVQHANRALQSVFQSRQLDNQEYDAWDVHFTDFISAASVKYDPVLARDPTPHYDTLTPLLQTPMGFPRQNTARETILALDKRNLNAPRLTAIVDLDATADALVDAFIDTYLEDLPELDDLTITLPDMQEWLDRQDMKPSERPMIIPGDAIFITALDRYLVNIKKKAKPPLLLNILAVYAALQTIIYSDKHINAIFSPIFSRLRDIVRDHMRPQFKIFSEMTSEELGVWLTHVSTRHATYAYFAGDDSTIHHNGVSLELDMSKFDKSQQQLALEFHVRLMLRLGVDRDLALLWYNSSVLASVFERTSRLRAFIPFQMRSGVANTFFGNTTWEMAVIALSFPLRSPAPWDLRAELDCERMATTFNLEVKPYFYKYAYFASRFVLPVEDHVLVLPDPFKLLVSLGRHDIANEQHREQLRSAVLDHTRGYNDDAAMHVLATAVQERYKLDHHPLELCILLYLLPRSPNFADLFFAAPGAVINRNLRPLPL